MPWLLLFLGLERCGVYLRAEFINTCEYTHVIHGPHTMNMMSHVDKAFCMASIVHRRQVYKTVWTPVLGEILTATQEPMNDHDRHGACVQKNEEIVGHVPRELS